MGKYRAHYYLILNYGGFCDFISQNARNIHAESVVVRKFLRWLQRDGLQSFSAYSIHFQYFFCDFLHLKISKKNPSKITRQHPENNELQHYLLQKNRPFGIMVGWMVGWERTNKAQTSFLIGPLYAKKDRKELQKKH